MTLLTTAVEWRKHGKWIPFQDLNIFLQTVGSGPPVLVLHGFPTSSYDFMRIAPILAKQFKLILFDYPGFGFSDKPDAPIYSIGKYAETAQHVSAHFGFNQVYILAHDIGDSVALELLRRNWPIVTRLVLLNGSILSTPFREFKILLIQKLLLHPLAGLLLNRLGIVNKVFFSSMLQKIFFEPLSPQEIEAFWSLLRFNNGTAIYYRLIQYMRERWQHEHMWLDCLQAHAAPLTLIWGEADPVAPPTIASYVLKLRPDSNYIRLQNVAHYPQWEAPQKVALSIHRAFTGNEG